MFNFENKRKMKKIVLVCIVAIMATAAQAQIYVGAPRTKNWLTSPESPNFLLPQTIPPQPMLLSHISEK